MPSAPSVEALKEIAANFAKQISLPSVVYLKGELGAGKTTFVQGLLESLGSVESVKSPTFTLVQPYEDMPLLVYHYDFYRLKQPEELESMGIRDYFGEDAVHLIEWPEKGEALLPKPNWIITFTIKKNQTRLIEIEACHP